MLKKVTLRWLKKHNACLSGIDWFESYRGSKYPLTIVRKLVRGDKEKIQWASWLIIRSMNKKQKVQYAMYAAEQVLCFLEKEHPDDLRFRKPIKVAKEYLKRQSKKNKNAAAAADAAYVVVAHVDAVANKKTLINIVKYGVKILGGVKWENN